MESLGTIASLGCGSPWGMGWSREHAGPGRCFSQLLGPCRYFIAREIELGAEHGFFGFAHGFTSLAALLMGVEEARANNAREKAIVWNPQRSPL